MKRFENRIDAQDSGTEKVRSPWNFDAPNYDERSGPYICAGSDYGVGVNQKIGNFPEVGEYAIPLRPEVFSPYEARED